MGFLQRSIDGRTLQPAPARSAAAPLLDRVREAVELDAAGSPIRAPIARRLANRLANTTDVLQGILD